MTIKERIAALLHDYYLEHHQLPRRITVSSEVARELDAAIEVDKEKFSVALASFDKPKLLREGHAVWFKGVLVVADLVPKEVLDVR